jgi:hypothetical protein
MMRRGRRGRKMRMWRKRMWKRMRMWVASWSNSLSLEFALDQFGTKPRNLGNLSFIEKKLKNPRLKGFFERLELAWRRLL